MLKNFLVEILDVPLDEINEAYIPPKYFMGKKTLVSYSCDQRLCYITIMGKYYSRYIHRKFIKILDKTPVNNGEFSYCYWCKLKCCEYAYNIRNERYIFYYCPKCLR